MKQSVKTRLRYVAPKLEAVQVNVKEGMCQSIFIEEYGTEKFFIYDADEDI